MHESTAAAWLRLVSCSQALLSTALLAGCGGAGAFECEEASQCSLPGQVGTCEPDGYCSFPDPTCPSGQRYGEHAGAGLAKTCVPTQEPTGSAATTDDGPGVIEGSGTGQGSTADPLPLDGTSMMGSTAPLDPSEGATTTSSTASSTSSATTSGSTSDTAAEETSAVGSETGLPSVVLSYPATIAECNDPINLDPDACELGATPSMGAMVADLDDTGVGPMHVFLRFDLDDAVQPDAVRSVTLRLVVTSSAMGPSSGEVYRVEPFGLMELYAVQPATVGAVLAPAQGPLVANDVVEWALPADLVALHGPTLYLGVLPVSTDGIDYWNLDGAVPPELIVEQLP